MDRPETGTKLASHTVALVMDADTARYVNQCLALASAMGEGNLRQQITILVALKETLREAGIAKINAFGKAFFQSCQAAFPEMAASTDPCEHCNCGRAEPCCYCGEVH